MRQLLLIGWFALSCGCAGAGAEGPLRVSLGAPRGEVLAALERQDYCKRERKEQKTETYPRCETAGMELGESWVVARYDGDGRLQSLSRYEVIPEERAASRFEQLIERRRGVDGPGSKEARARLAELGAVPAGASSWVSWFVDGGRAIATVYRLEVDSPRKPNVLEEIRWAEGRSSTEPK